MITVTDSFYHCEHSVMRNKVFIGAFGPSEVVNPYQSPLCFHIDSKKFTSAELREIATLLDDKNKGGAN
tara:strand:- start:104 stop:310 length:207 start_codon:yes stop_codon:yes gene_type:complete